MYGIFFIATSWGRQNGGINSINYSLVKNLAKSVDAKKWKIYCVLTENKVDSDVISTVLEKENISLICTKTPKTSTSIKKEIREKNFEQLFFVGHDIITGTYANELRDNYPNATSIILHHMSYRSYYYTREKNPEKIRDKESSQKDIIPNADIIVAVGPLLKESAQDLCIDARKNTEIDEIIPGLEEIEPIKDIHNNHTIILFGRLEDKNNGVKQITLAISAVSEFMKDKDKNFIIKCYGYLEDSEKNQEKLLAKAFKEAGRAVNITANAYINDTKKLREEISSASLCIMPSYCEGFGLAAYEAISAGVPVIISKNTGLYKFLSNKQGESIDHLFESLNISGNPSNNDKPYTEADLKNLKQCIEKIFSNYQKSKNNALLLRTKLIDSHYTWDYTARKFLEIIEQKIRVIPRSISKTDDFLEKKRVQLSDYISDNLIDEHCASFCDPKKVDLKIIKYSNNRERRFTLFSSYVDYYDENQKLKTRLINDGIVGILNETFEKESSCFPMILGDFTRGECHCIKKENDIICLTNVSLGVPDHQVLLIAAVPLIYESNIVGAVTLDIYDEMLAKEIENNTTNKLNMIYRNLKLFSNNLISRFYYEIKDNINFSEVNKMLLNRELVSFKGRCPMDCKHCFAREITDENEEENDIEDIINDLKSKKFDVVYVSHYKENFYNAEKGVCLCEKIYDEFNCDICVITRCILTSELLVRISNLNDKMKLRGNKLTFCISIPAYDSYAKFEKSKIVPTPQQRIDFAGQLKDSSITTIVTIRPMFPSSIVPTSEIYKIVDNCANKVDAILTGGLYVSDSIIKCLNINKEEIEFLHEVESEYLVGVEKKFKAVDVEAEINSLKKYCQERGIPFFKHSMDALNYFK